MKTITKGFLISLLVLTGFTMTACGEKSTKEDGVVTAEKTTEAVKDETAKTVETTENVASEMVDKTTEAAEEAEAEAVEAADEDEEEKN